MHGCEAERLCCLVVFGAGPGQRSSKHWMSSSELSESQAVITPRSPTHSRQLTTPVTPECVCVCVCLKKKGGVDWEGETKWKTRSICGYSKYASCVSKRVCAQTSMWPQCEQKLWMCVAEKKGGCFFSPLSSSLSPCQSYSISHPSIFHFYMQLQMWRQWNIKLQKLACTFTLAVSKTTQPLLSPDLTHTFSHFDHSSTCVWISIAGKRRKAQQCYILLKWFECDLMHHLFSFSSIHPPHCVRVRQQPPQLDEALAEASQCAVPVKATRCCRTVLQLNDLKQNTLSHYSSVMSCTLEIQENRKIEVWAFLAAESLSRNVVISNLVEWNE